MSISDDTEGLEPASPSYKPEYSKRALRGDKLLMRSFRLRIEQSAIWWSLCAATRTQAGMTLLPITSQVDGLRCRPQLLSKFKMEAINDILMGVLKRRGWSSTLSCRGRGRRWVRSQTAELRPWRSGLRSIRQVLGR